MEMWMLTQNDDIKDMFEKLGGYLTLCQTQPYCMQPPQKTDFFTTTDNITVLQLS